jgi:cyclin D7, plant
MDDSSLLYCDEDPLVVSTTPPPQLASNSYTLLAPQQQAASDDAEEEDHHLKELLVDHMAKQRSYAPTCREGYLEHLLPRRTTTQPEETITIPGPGSVSAARSGGVHYIIYVSITTLRTILSEAVVVDHHQRLYYTRNTISESIDRSAGVW